MSRHSVWLLVSLEGPAERGWKVGAVFLDSLTSAFFVFCFRKRPRRSRFSDSSIGAGLVQIVGYPPSLRSVFERVR